jgi:hypothetical protein
MEIWIFQKAQRGFEHRPLARRIVRAVEWIAVGEGNAESARRADLLRHLAKELERDRRDPLSFELR